MTNVGSGTTVPKKGDSKKSGGYIFCRYRRVKNSNRYLDAHDYGYEAWRIPIRK